jgi:hypothetical protein
MRSRRALFPFDFGTAGLFTRIGARTTLPIIPASTASSNARTALGEARRFDRDIRDEQCVIPMMSACMILRLTIRSTARR